MMTMGEEWGTSEQIRRNDVGRVRVDPHGQINALFCQASVRHM